MNLEFKKELQVINVQISSTENINHNLKNIQKILQSIVIKNEPVDLVCFPENSLFMRIGAETPIHLFRIEDLMFSEIALFAMKLNCYIHLGSVPLEIGGQNYNSTIWFSPLGNIEVGYQKIHLFDVEIEGQRSISESDFFQHGSKPNIKNIFGWKIGESICYDLRFSELYNFYARNDVDLILIPSAFLEVTGKVHWHTLVKARAIESQAYVVASAQTGVLRSSLGLERSTYGHSLIVDPWGIVLSDQKTNIEIAKITLKRTNIEKVRAQIPMKNHRRLI